MGTGRTKIDLSVFLLALLCEGAFAALALSSYRASPLESLREFLTSPPGLVCLAAGLLALATAVTLVRLWRSLSPNTIRQATLSLALNVVTIALALVMGEATLRILHEVSMRVPGWSIDFPVLRSWERTSDEFRAALGNGSTTAYHEFDPELGWKIGINRMSADGLYASNRQGLRSARPGETRLNWTMGDTHLTAAPQQPSRVALIGDSYTFGYEVAYEDTWAHQLATRLQPRFDVVNFGVIGYSINQVRLKYERDVRPLHPDMVVVGIISHDFKRDTFIYNFLPFPDMLSLPFARPRPILREGRLEMLNVPLPTPTEIFAAKSIHQLPYLQADINYNWLEWERAPWRWLQHSMLFRTAVSLPAGVPSPRKAAFEQEQRLLNRAVLQALSDAIRKDGATPLFLFFPEAGDMHDDSSRTDTPSAPYGLSLLAEMDLPHEDMRGCLRGMRPEGRHTPGNHLTPAANAAIAACLPEVIQKHLTHDAPPHVIAEHPTSSS